MSLFRVRSIRAIGNRFSNSCRYFGNRGKSKQSGYSDDKSIDKKTQISSESKFSKKYDRMAEEGEFYDTAPLTRIAPSTPENQHIRNAISNCKTNGININIIEIQ